MTSFRCKALKAAVLIGTAAFSAHKATAADSSGEARFPGSMLFQFDFIYQDAGGHSCKAIYFDSEGHVIHYNVTTPLRTR